MKLIHAAGAVLVAAIWGCNFVAAKIGMETFGPFFYTALRFVVVGAVLLPFVARPSKNEMKQIALFALMLCVLHMAVMIAALQVGLSVGATVIISQLGVPFSVVMGTFLLNDTLGKWRTLGLVISFLGIFMIAGTPDVFHNMPAFALALGGAFAWGVSNIQLKKMPKMPVLRLLAWVSVFAVPMLLAVSLVLEGNQWQYIPAAPPQAWVAALYTGIASTVAAYGIWSYLIRTYEVSHVAPFSLLTPIFGVACGVLYFGESLTALLVAGGVVTIMGVAIITVRRPKLLQFGE